MNKEADIITPTLCYFCFQSEYQYRPIKKDKNRILPHAFPDQKEIVQLQLVPKYIFKN